MDAYSTPSVNIQIETFNEYQYIIYKLDFCSYNISFDFRDLVEDLVEGKLICRDPSSHHAIDASSCIQGQIFYLFFIYFLLICSSNP